MVSRCLSATGIRFSVILFPPGSWALLTVGLPDPTGPDPDGVSPFRTPEQRPGWAPSVPRGRRCSSRTGATSRPAPAASQRPVLAPRPHPTGGALAYEASTKGSRVFARPVFPCLRPPGWNGPSLGFRLGLRTPPTGAGQRTSRRGQAIEHGPGTTSSTHTSISNPGSSLTMCDLVSHVARRSSGRARLRRFRFDEFISSQPTAEGLPSSWARTRLGDVTGNVYTT